MWIMEIHHSGTKRCWNGSGQENDRLGETSPTFKRVQSSTRLLRFAQRWTMNQLFHHRNLDLTSRKDQIIDLKSSLPGHPRDFVFLRSRSVQAQPKRRLEVNASNNNLDFDKRTKPRYDSEFRKSVRFHIGDHKTDKNGVLASI
jgi:hypothetical protein